LPGRRQQHFLRREAAHHRQRGRRPGPLLVPAVGAELRRGAGRADRPGLLLTMPNWDLAAEVRARREADLYRRTRAIRFQGAWAELEGRRLRVFCSNDYLGLAAEPRVVQAFQRAAAEHGVGRDRKSTRLNSSHVKISYA